MRHLKKVSIFILIMCLLLSASLISCNNSQNSNEPDEEKYVIKSEIIGGHLWITYSDNPTSPVDAGKVENTHDGSEGLDFHLLPDNTYGVTIGTADQLEQIVIPAVYNGRAVTKILQGGFSQNFKVKAVVMPASVTEIESSAFSACISLEEVYMPGVKKIGEFAFSSCTSLNTVRFYEGLEGIYSYAFSNTHELKDVIIPSTVVNMGNNAFGNNIDTVIKCVSPEKPEFWDDDWASGVKEVIWGYEG